ncbi:hypothetical protein FGB62_335g03 [Gracilaria domingensis]|nr:hypothetical protein FGB62_335g03 [Gracilaria domingensis]
MVGLVSITSTNGKREVQAALPGGDWERREAMAVMPDSPLGLGKRSVTIVEVQLDARRVVVAKQQVRESVAIEVGHGRAAVLLPAEARVNAGARSDVAKRRHDGRVRVGVQRRGDAEVDALRRAKARGGSKQQREVKHGRTMRHARGGRQRGRGTARRATSVRRRRRARAI